MNALQTSLRAARYAVLACALLDNAPGCELTRAWTEIQILAAQDAAREADVEYGRLVAYHEILEGVS